MLSKCNNPILDHLEEGNQFPMAVKSLEIIVFCMNSGQTILTRSQFIWERVEGSSWQQTQECQPGDWASYQENAQPKVLLVKT